MMITRLRELYGFRELVWALVVRELKVKYKNSVLGFLWSLLNPVLTMLVFTFVFSFVFRAGIKDFPLFFLAGLLPWNSFSLSLNRATTSMIENANLIKKVYFPREVIPFSILITNLINFGLELVVLFVFLLAWGYFFLPYLPVVLLAVVLLFLFTGGLAMFLSAAAVYFRDLQQLVPLGVMIWFYGTAVIYPLDFIPASVRPILAYGNPMNPLISLFRGSLYGLQWPEWQTVVYCVVAAVAVFVLGYVLFARLARELAKEV
nr:ABC transporter permease [Actinomycetales bacterium]